MTVGVFGMTVIAVLSLMTGFWAGRSIRWMMDDTEKCLTQEAVGEAGKRDKGLHIPLGFSMGSPVTGQVRNVSEGSRRGARILPEEGRLYAPASGKITRLFPMGNAMLLQADCGVELLLCACEDKDDLHSRYYRARVVQNEIVGKGKLLLEFDREALEQEGVDTTISITAEAADNLDVTVTPKERVRVGEELLWVRRECPSELF